VDYIHLTKPRSVLLLLMAALTGMVVVLPEGLPFPLVLQTMLAGAFAAGGANVLNCYLDRDLDRRMDRTSGRPLPSGKLLPSRALLFGLALSVVSITVFAVGVNWLSAVLAGCGIFYYVIVYTLWLKRATHWNVVIGGAAGALPLLVGSAAASGGVAPPALWLGVVVLLWTPPHFWSLALLRLCEYAAAGVPMLPVVRGEVETRRQILGYSVLLFLVTLLLAPVGFAGAGFLAATVCLGAVLLFLAVRLLIVATDLAARRLYRYSIAYLALLFISMILDRVTGWLPLSGAS
jgi:protoheme IX farnesyltransferase